jgi:hypothetical protein
LFDTIDLEQLEYWGTKEQAWLKFVPMGT